ncbi:MAG TPA: radical SAM protein [Candidatus Omnitrophota bacterium]|nr:radical SAM protein [Candidatus Omnitrophota bacterium]
MRLNTILGRNFQKTAFRLEAPGSVQDICNSSIVVALTTRCNFQCKHCLRGSSAARDLPFELFEKLVHSARKFNYNFMSLTGGEPLLYPYFKEALELSVKNGYKFNFATNGHIFDKFAGIIEKYRDRTSGVIFSLESVDEALQDDMRQKGSYNTLLKDFEICRKAKIPFYVQTVISPRNYDEIFDLAVFAKKKGARALRLTTTLPCSRASENKLVLDREKRDELFVLFRHVSKVLKYPILSTSAIKAQNNVMLCGALSFAELALNVNGEFIQCCDLGDNDIEKVKKNAIITSFKDKTFAQALKVISEYQHKFHCLRIDDFEKDPSRLEFNNRLYCINSLNY